MTLDAPQDLRRFALRRFADTELPAVEERLLLEDGFAEQLRDAEYDLLDDYAAGRLDAGERRDVERHLLATAADATALKVTCAIAALRRTAEASPLAAADHTAAPREPGPAPLPRHRAPRGHALRLVAVAATVSAVAVIGYEGSRMHDQRIRAQSAASASLAAHERERAPQAAPVVADPGATLTVALSADHPRGAETRVVELARTVRTLRLQAEIGDPTPGASYELTVGGAAPQAGYAARGIVPRVAGAYRYVEVDVPRGPWLTGEQTVTLRRDDVAPSLSGPTQWLIRVDAGR